MFSHLLMMLKMHAIQVSMRKVRGSPRLSSILCGFPEDSLMAEVIKQEGWTKLENITIIAVDEIKDLRLLRGDGMHLGFSMMVHIRMFKAFLLYYKRRSRDPTYPLDEVDVLEYTKFVFNEYCRSDQ
jgi:hypothetical protein